MKERREVRKIEGLGGRIVFLLSVKVEDSGKCQAPDSLGWLGGLGDRMWVLAGFPEKGILAGHPLAGLPFSATLWSEAS